MSISVYDVNTFLQNDATLTSIAGKEVQFFPIVGYGDEDPPFIVYYFSPSIESVESFWNRFDNVRYTLFDNDIDRMYRLSERMIYLLGRGDTVGESGGITSSNHRFKSAVFVGASPAEAIEKEGWYQLDLDFRIYSTLR